jgi:hypothetical protein
MKDRFPCDDVQKIKDKIKYLDSKSFSELTGKQLLELIVLKTIINGPSQYSPIPRRSK